MNNKFAIDLTENAKKQVVKWWESNSRFQLADVDALIDEIRIHPRFGDDGFSYYIASFESKDGTPKSYGFGVNDYVYEEEEE